MTAVRTLVVGCVDWALVAAGAPPSRPAAVLQDQHVLACTAAARAAGVRRGLRQREAQARCPELEVLTHDPTGTARAFEPVVATVAAFAPRVEIVQPGVCALATRGPSRYFGGDAALASKVKAAVTEVLTDLLPTDRRPDRCRVGIADGPFAALLAAGRQVVVPVGDSRAFLAPFSITVLDRPELTDLLRRLGITTLGAFAALDEPDVMGRFGTEGARAHRLARGLDERPLAPRPPRADLVVSHPFDPPAERVDVAAFTARSLAAEFQERLLARGVVCTRLAIEVETAHGERLIRLWRHMSGPFTPAAIAERVRWQLDGWLSGSGSAAARPSRASAEPGSAAARPSRASPEPGSAAAPSGGISVLRLRADELRPAGEAQLDLWDASAAIDAQVGRALSRVQGLLGPEGASTAVLGGGRSPAEQVRLVVWGDPREPARPGLPGTVTVRVPTGVETPPWPGRLPPPAPAVVHAQPLPADVRDHDDRPVSVTARCTASSEPARISIAAGPWLDVVGWAGPWPVDERWWDPDSGRRRARFQVALADGNAYLLALEKGRWWIEASYD